MHVRCGRKLKVVQHEPVDELEAKTCFCFQDRGQFLQSLFQLPLLLLRGEPFVHVLIFIHFFGAIINDRLGAVCVLYFYWRVELPW